MTKLLVEREARDKFYSINSHYIAFNIYNFPLDIIYPCILVAISYYVIELNHIYPYKF